MQPANRAQMVSEELCVWFNGDLSVWELLELTVTWESGGSVLPHRIRSSCFVSMFHIRILLLPWTLEIIQEGSVG